MNARVIPPAPSAPEWQSVAAFSMGRAYGGPEEGGWFYDTGDRLDETVRAFSAGDAPQVAEYVALLRRRLHGPIFSVRVFDERLPPAYFPESRPEYQ